MPRHALLGKPMTAAERARRRRVKFAAQHEPKHYLVEALDLLDRIDKTTPPKAAKEILHLIALEAAKRERRIDRLAGA
jgi:hypothetical protein